MAADRDLAHGPLVAQYLSSGEDGAVTTMEPPEGDEHLAAIVFDKPGRASEVLLNLIHLQQDGALQLGDAVVIVKDPSGRARIHQTSDITPGRGALIGGWWGLLAGLLVGPLAIAGGAAAGALYGKLVDRGLDDEWVKQMSQWLDAGHSALLLLLKVENEPEVLRELGRYEGELVVTNFPEPVRRELERALADEAASPT